MDIKKELSKRAEFFNKHMNDFLASREPELLYDAAKHLPIAGGKRLRPIIAMLSCEAVNGDVEDAIPLAIAIELIHNFTLVHDDIMDNSKIRRNIQTVHTKFGLSTAIMAGDLLFAKSFESMHKLKADCEIFKNLEHRLIKCIINICEGQQMDTEFEKRKDVSEEDYMKMISKKTAVLFQYAAEGGGIIGKGSIEQIDALSEYGKNLGLGFQIHDDYLDFSSEDCILGKDIGNDIRNGKKTLVAVHALDNAIGENKKFLEKMIGNKNVTRKDIEKIYTIFKKAKSIDYTKSKAKYLINKAKNALDILPSSNAKKILLEIADYAIKREK